MHPVNQQRNPEMRREIERHTVEIARNAKMRTIRNKESHSIFYSKLDAFGNSSSAWNRIAELVSDDDVRGLSVGIRQQNK